MEFRELYEEILTYGGTNLSDDILIPWVDSNASIVLWLEGISTMQPSDAENFNQEDSWELYALSRVLDLLTLGFQPNNNCDDSPYGNPLLTVNEYIYFAELLGCKPVDHTQYNPFYHEILEAKPGFGDLKLMEVVFPALMLNQLLIKKAGTIVACNSEKYNLSVINQSTIYWAFRRKNRPYSDLSHGWGHNSQWRTSCRLDFDAGGKYYFNAGGSRDLNSPNADTLKILEEDQLTLENAIELTINRHFIHVEDNNDQYPYDFIYILE